MLPSSCTSLPPKHKGHLWRRYSLGRFLVWVSEFAAFSMSVRSMTHQELTQYLMIMHAHHRLSHQPPFLLPSVAGHQRLGLKSECPLCSQEQYTIVEHSRNVVAGCPW